MGKKWVKDSYLRDYYSNQELRYRFCKVLLKNVDLPSDIRVDLEDYCCFVGRKKSKIRNLCVVTGRARGVFRDFKVSRLTIKKLHRQSQGSLFIGVKKSSW